MNFGNAVYMIRKNLNLSQQEFAKIIEIDQSYLSLIENNKKKPSLTLLEKIGSKTNTPFPILMFFSLSADDISEEKKQLFNIIFPKIKEMILDIY